MGPRVPIALSKRFSNYSCLVGKVGSEGVDGSDVYRILSLTVSILIGGKLTIFFFRS